LKISKTLLPTRATAPARAKHDDRPSKARVKKYVPSSKQPTVMNNTLVVIPQTARPARANHELGDRQIAPDWARFGM